MLFTVIELVAHGYPDQLLARADIQAQVLAMEAGITSRRKVVEGTGYDIEEVDRENAADARRAAELGLRYRTSPGETQGARATPAARPRST